MVTGQNCDTCNILQIQHLQKTDDINCYHKSKLHIFKVLINYLLTIK